MIDLGPLGDRGFLARFDTEAHARGWANSVRASSWPGVLDVVLAYRGVAVFADPDRIDLDDLHHRLAALSPTSAEETLGRHLVIPVLYDGEDLPVVSAKLSLSIEDVIALHSGRDYRVLAVGFLPGFPYVGDLAPELSGLSRRDSPRPRVPAGSVAIAGRQTGIYPEESPGGWHLIGRTPLRIVDFESGHFPLVAGDSLRFHPIGASEYRARLGELLSRSTGPGTDLSARIG